MWRVIFLRRRLEGPEMAAVYLVALNEVNMLERWRRGSNWLNGINEQGKVRGVVFGPSRSRLERAIEDVRDIGQGRKLGVSVGAVQKIDGNELGIRSKSGARRDRPITRKSPRSKRCSTM